MTKRLVLFIWVVTAILIWSNFCMPRLDAVTVQGDEKAKEILKKMDELYRSNTSVARFEMQIITPNWQRTLQVDAWTQGLEKSFFRILSPMKERGTATLKVGNEIWNFLPKTDKVMKIPPSMMMGSWMGSDFTNDDLVKEYTFMDDYTFRMVTVPNPESGVVYVKAVPKENLPIVWGWIITAVREKDYLPVWQKYYDEKGRPMREMIYSEIKTFGKRTIPSVMELIPTNKPGQKTVVRYLDVRFDTKLDNEIFSLRHLQEKM
ncbi:MAG: outer membrane lipoprotein-sorting protein [Candidatus Omnitrophota bacterium]